MIYIYVCFAGTHSSSLAAAIHLRKLPVDRVPTGDEILNTDYFNKLKHKDMGRFIFRGIDEEGNKVFTVGKGSSKVLIPCVKNLITLANNEYGLSDRIIISSLSSIIPVPMAIGGFMSRRLGIDFIGVPLLVMGSKQVYNRIVNIVDTTRKSAKNLNEPVLVLMNN